MQIQIKLLNPPNEIQILSGRSNATFNTDKSIL